MHRELYIFIFTISAAAGTDSDNECVCINIDPSLHLHQEDSMSRAKWLREIGRIKMFWSAPSHIYLILCKRDGWSHLDAKGNAEKWPQVIFLCLKKPRRHKEPKNITKDTHRSVEKAHGVHPRPLISRIGTFLNGVWKIIGLKKQTMTLGGQNQTCFLHWAFFLLIGKV